MDTHSSQQPKQIAMNKCINTTLNDRNILYYFVSFSQTVSDICGRRYRVNEAQIPTNWYIQQTIFQLSTKLLSRQIINTYSDGFQLKELLIKTLSTINLIRKSSSIPDWSEQ